MSDMSTFGNNDSVFSHGENSISMLKRLVEITKEAYKYLPEKDCTVACGTFVDVDTRAFLSAVQHFRESIEAYRDITEELEDDLREVRKAYADDMKRICGKPFNIEEDVQQLKEDLEHFRTIARSRSKELDEERERSTRLEKQLEEEHQRYMKLREAKEHSPAYWKSKFERMQKSYASLDEYCSKSLEEYEQRIKVLTAERDLAKKIAKEKTEKLKIQLNEKYGISASCVELKAKLDKKCKEVGELTHELWELQEKAEFWKDVAKKGYIDTDIAHMYPKTTLNNPANFCGNCSHYAQMGKDNGEFEGICTQHYIKRVDPDDASCKFFKATYDTRVVIGKPEFPVCEKCNRDDCDNCTLCPF